MIIHINDRCSASDEIPVASSAIAGDLVDSYHHAIYRIDTGPGSIALRIGQFSQPLSDLLNELKCTRAAIISAYNPYSQQLGYDENETAHRSLRKLLIHRSYPIIEGINLDPSGHWPVEKNFFAAGLDFDTAKFIGQKYSQNAILWMDEDAVPRLVLLR